MIFICFLFWRKPRRISFAQKKTMKPLKTIAAFALITAFASSCDDFMAPGKSGTSELRWHFLSPKTVLTKSYHEEIPDTNDFILSVFSSNGKTLFTGPYGSSPESLTVDEGSYTVEVKSEEFTAPAFGKPQYGDSQIIVVGKGEKAEVALNCRMLNSGFRLDVKDSFRNAFPSGVLFLNSSEGKLMYSYYEDRVAFFKPGQVSLTLSDGGKDEILFTKTLESREVLTVGLSASVSGSLSEGMTIVIDTTKIWKSEDYIAGEGSPEGERIDDALSVAEAKAAIGEKDVWVYGYIVGGDLSSSGSKMNTGPTFTKNTHFAIAARSSVTSKESCLSVELPKGPIRDALNLVSHPDLLGSRVYLKGDIVESYYGIPGIKQLSDYMLK